MSAVLRITAAVLLLAACLDRDYLPSPPRADGGEARADGGQDAGVDAGIPPTEVHFDGGITSCFGCHGTVDNPAPPPDTQGRTETSFATVGAHQAHLYAWRPIRKPQCSDCHLVPGDVSDPGHLDNTPGAELTWGPIAAAGGVVPAYEGGRCTVYCHGASLPGGEVQKPLWTKVDGTQTFCGSCHAVPMLPPHPRVYGGTCGPCHPFNGMLPIDPERHGDGILDLDLGAGCGACHELPPPTGSHSRHASLAAPAYGGLGTAESVGADGGAGGYAFGCGYCHPLDERLHANGTVEVELYNPIYSFDGGAPLKARNPSTAEYVPGATRFTDSFGIPYTLGTCRNIECHSGTRVTTGEVPAPTLGVPPPGSIDFQVAGYDFDYPLFPLTRARDYREVTWGSGPLGCGGCHGYPPRTSYPAVKAAAGDSHSWIDDSGYENLHLFNMGSRDPVQCRTCHARTVRDEAPFTRDAMDVLTFTEDLPIRGYDRHVNGVADVEFDRVNPVEYHRRQDGGLLASFSLANGDPDGGVTYDPGTKTCNNVPCHFAQTRVTWGRPYRWTNSAECDSCHHHLWGP
jgi:predicted CxxxxCH...CXXCH cytochrome family protein